MRKLDPMRSWLNHLVVAGLVCSTSCSSPHGKQGSVPAVVYDNVARDTYSVLIRNISTEDGVRLLEQILCTEFLIPHLRRQFRGIYNSRNRAAFEYALLQKGAAILAAGSETPEHLAVLIKFYYGDLDEVKGMAWESRVKIPAARVARLQMIPGSPRSIEVVIESLEQERVIVMVGEAPGSFLYGEISGGIMKFDLSGKITKIELQRRWVGDVEVWIPIAIEHGPIR
jgi:hypothetical protein